MRKPIKPSEKTKKHLLINCRLEIFLDFCINLSHKIKEYYLDKESLSKDKDMRSHFDWCFNIICEESLLEDIDFTRNEALREYFYKYYLSKIYKNYDIMNDGDINIRSLEKYWNSMFDMYRKRSDNDTKNIVEIYDIFNSSILLNEKILENN